MDFLGDGRAAPDLRLGLLQILCRGKPLAINFYPNRTIISLNKSVLHGIPQIVFGMCSCCCLIGVLLILLWLMDYPTWSLNHVNFNEVVIALRAWEVMTSICESCCRVTWVVWRLMTFHIWGDVYVGFISCIWLVINAREWLAYPLLYYLSTMLDIIWLATFPPYMYTCVCVSCFR